MWWWIFFTYLCNLWQKNGMVMNKIYCYNKCSSGGLEIIKFYARIENFDGKNDKLMVLCDITVHVYSLYIYIYIYSSYAQCL